MLNYKSCNAQLSCGESGHVFGDVIAHTYRLTLREESSFYCYDTQPEPLYYQFTQQVSPSHMIFVRGAHA